MESRREAHCPVIGVTGGVGSGNSAFVKALESLGAKALDADRIARRLVDEDPLVRERLGKSFGAEIFDTSGNLRRSELSDRVFSDSARLQELNGIIWPPLIHEIEGAIREHRLSGNPAPLIVDMAVLFEAGCERLFDAVVAVEAPIEKRIQWLSVSRGWDRTKIERRMSSQMDVREKSRRAGWTVLNDGTLDDLAFKARSVYRAILKRFN
jgi:dephospho-CoA kinase